jgi:uncharacterized membrane protein
MDLVCSARNFLAQGFRSLPTIIGGAILVLGLTQANYNYLFFFLGMILFAPIVALITNVGLEAIANKSKFIKDAFSVFGGSADQCSLFPILSSKNLNIESFFAPSYWMATIAFFFGYILANAFYLMSNVNELNISEEGKTLTKTQMISSIIIIFIVAALTFIARFALTGCETGASMFLGILFSLVGWGWYDIIHRCRLRQFSDLFGIWNRTYKL